VRNAGLDGVGGKCWNGGLRGEGDVVGECLEGETTRVGALHGFDLPKLKKTSFATQILPEQAAFA